MLKAREEGSKSIVTIILSGGRSLKHEAVLSSFLPFLFVTYRSKRITQIQCLKEFGDQFQWAYLVQARMAASFQYKCSCEAGTLVVNGTWLSPLCFIIKFKPKMRRLSFSEHVHIPV